MRNGSVGCLTDFTLVMQCVPESVPYNGNSGSGFYLRRRGTRIVLIATRTQKIVPTLIIPIEHAD